MHGLTDLLCLRLNVQAGVDSVHLVEKKDGDMRAGRRLESGMSIATVDTNHEEGSPHGSSLDDQDAHQDQPPRGTVMAPMTREFAPWSAKSC